MTETSETAMLDRLLDAYYGAMPHPETIRLTLAQAQRINYEMHPNEMRLAIDRKEDLLVLGVPVEWVDDEAESILAIRTLAGRTVPGHIRFEVTTGDVHLTCSAPGCSALGATARVWQIDDDGWAIGPFLREHAHAARCPVDDLTGYTVTSDSTDPTVAVLALHADKKLGYLRASGDWVDGTTEPLTEDLQEAADGLVRAGLLPEFVHFFDVDGSEPFEEGDCDDPHAEARGAHADNWQDPQPPPNRPRPTASAPGRTAATTGGASASLSSSTLPSDNPTRASRSTS